MSLLSFDDLVGKQYLVPVPLDIPGVGTVHLHQISAEEASEVDQNVSALEGDELDRYISSRAAKFVKGSEPTDEEVDQLRRCHTGKTIGLIYVKGLQSAAPAVGDLEEAEKK